MKRDWKKRFWLNAWNWFRKALLAVTKFLPRLKVVIWLRWLDRVMQDHEARTKDVNRKLTFSFFLLFSQSKLLKHNKEGSKFAVQQSPLISRLSQIKTAVQRRKWSPTANDPQTGNDPQIEPQVIPNRNDPRCGPQMIPSENEEWHGVWILGLILFYFLLLYLFIFSSTKRWIR